MQIRHLPPAIVLRGTFEDPRSIGFAFSQRRYRAWILATLGGHTQMWDDELCTVYLSVERLGSRNED